MKRLNSSHSLGRGWGERRAPQAPHARSPPALRSVVVASSFSHHDGNSNHNRSDQHQLSRRQALLAGGGMLLLTSPSNSAEIAAVSSATAPLGFESRVSEFTLSNGLHFIIMERHNAPVVSCHTHARVGAYIEPTGSTGLAHLMEHLAFKGTPQIGSKDWRREQAVLQAQDEVFYELRALKQQQADAGCRSSSCSARMQQLQERMQKLKSQGEELIVPNAFGSILQEAGAIGLNAATSHDNTRYYVSLPSNKLELWFALESQRFQAPVLRELYTEKEVIVEERRARENSPLSKFTSDFLMQALDNPYRRPVIGFASDFDAFGSREVTAFFNKYYHPKNITISIVGDVNPADVQQLAEKYFGSWAAAAGAVTLDSSIQQLAAESLPHPAAVLAATDRPGPGPGAGSGSSSGIGGRQLGIEVSQQLSSAAAAAAAGGGGFGAATNASSDMFVQRSAAGPLVALGYYRPSLTGRRGTALEVAADILSGGRSSRLIKQLVLQNKCLSASCLPGYPGELHPGLALVSAVPPPGGDMKQLTTALQQQLDMLYQDGPTAQELARVKAGARAALLGALTSNSSMAAILAAYHTVSGSWRGVLQELDDVDSLTGQEVAAEAAAVFGATNQRFTGMALPL